VNKEIIGIIHRNSHGRKPKEKKNFNEEEKSALKGSYKKSKNMWTINPN